MFAGENQSHLLVRAQQEPACSLSCCACGLLASLLAFHCICFPLVTAFLSILISLHLLWWSSVIFWGCGPGRRLHLCWLQGMVLQWGPFSQHHSSFSFSGHQRNTSCPASHLLPCRRAGSEVVQGIPLSQFPSRDVCPWGAEPTLRSDGRALDVVKKVVLFANFPQGYFSPRTGFKHPLH